MLPSLDCDEVSCDLDCHTFYDVIGDVVRIGYTAMCEMLPEEACVGIEGFVSVGEPSLAVGEYIAGWLIEYLPFNPANSRQAAAQMFARPSVTVGLKLLEQGWPQGEVDGGVIMAPSPADLNAMAYHSMGHHEKITRRLAKAVANREPGATTGCTFMNINRSRPIQPSSGLVGWTWELLLEVSF